MKMNISQSLVLGWLAMVGSVFFFLHLVFEQPDIRIIYELNLFLFCLVIRMAGHCVETNLN